LTSGHSDAQETVGVKELNVHGQTLEPSKRLKTTFLADITVTETLEQNEKQKKVDKYLHLAKILKSLRKGKQCRLPALASV